METMAIPTERGLTELITGLIAHEVPKAVAAALAAHQPPKAYDDAEFYTRAEVSRKLNLSYPTLRNLEIRGELMPRRIARRVLYRKADVLAALERGVRHTAHARRVRTNDDVRSEEAARLITVIR